MASVFENKNSSRITIWNDGKKVKMEFSKIMKLFLLNLVRKMLSE